MNLALRLAALTCVLPVWLMGCAQDPSMEAAEETTATLEAALSTAQCGGIASLPCPNGQLCVDDPKDTCDPKTGGADCSGVCVAKTTCNYDDDHYDYVSDDAAACSAMRFTCPSWQKAFFNECGCGCVDKPLCFKKNPQKEYLFSKSECSTVKYKCAPGSVPFQDSCGCGCK